MRQGLGAIYYVPKLFSRLCWLCFCWVIDPPSTVGRGSGLVLMEVWREAQAGLTCELGDFQCSGVCVPCASGGWSRGAITAIAPTQTEML